jgi:uncharacterized protein
LSLHPKALKFIASTAHAVRAGKQNFAQTVPSPCMSVCQMDEASGLCEGCLRTINEIAQWGNADDALKRTIWLNIEARLAQHIA